MMRFTVLFRGFGFCGSNGISGFGSEMYLKQKNHVRLPDSCFHNRSVIVFYEAVVILPRLFCYTQEQRWRKDWQRTG